MVAKRAEHLPILSESYEIGGQDWIEGQTVRPYTHIKFCAWLFEKENNNIEMVGNYAFCVMYMNCTVSLGVRVAAYSEPFVVAVRRHHIPKLGTLETRQQLLRSHDDSA